MNVNEIIKSLREEPERWIGDHHNLLRDIKYHSTIGGIVPLYSVYDYGGIDRLRLRFAIWRWKRNSKIIKQNKA